MDAINGNQAPQGYNNGYEPNPPSQRETDPRNDDEAKNPMVQEKPKMAPEIPKFEGFKDDNEKLKEKAAEDAKTTGRFPTFINKSTFKCKVIAGILAISFLILLYLAFKPAIAQVPLTGDGVTSRKYIQETGYRNVLHFIPHTHLDLGWIYPEQNLYQDQVHSILSSTLTYMTKNPDSPESRLTYSDMGFMYMHFKGYPKDIEGFRKIVSNGNFEVVGGGYVSADLATNSFDDLLANYQYGRKFIKRHLNKIPTASWNIDQFGHSFESARLQRQLGLQGGALTRIPSWMNNTLVNHHTGYFKWHISNKEGDYLHQLAIPEHYGLYQFMSNTENPNGDILDEGFNLAKKSIEYLEVFQESASRTAQRNKFRPYGDDFKFGDYEYDIRRPQQMLVFVNSNSVTGRFAGNFKFKFSSLKEYFKALKTEMKEGASISATPVELNPKQDLMPLIGHSDSSNNREVWSGFYTSSPVLKKGLKSFNELYRGLRNILVNHQSTSSAPSSSLQAIVNATEESEWVLAANLHHDTMTATSYNWVLNHYLLRKDINMRVSRLDWIPLIRSLIDIKQTSNSPKVDLPPYPLQAAPNDLYYQEQINPAFLEKERRIVEETGWDMRFIGPIGESTNIDRNGTYLFINQAKSGLKLLRISSNYSSLSISHKSKNFTKTTVWQPIHACYEHIVAVQMNAFESVLLSVTVQNKTASESEKWTDLIVPAESSSSPEASLGNPPTKIQFEAGVLKVGSKGSNIGIGVYSYIYDPSNNQQSSSEPNGPSFFHESFSLHRPGKYLFITTSKEPARLQPTAVRSMQDEQTGSFFVKMEYREEEAPCILMLQYLPFASPQLFVRLECKPLPTSFKDLVVRYSTDIKNEKLFLTDSNSFTPIPRQSWKIPRFIECNYYPITRFISLADNENRFSVVVERSEGGTSPSEGVLEVMFNRVSTGDDSLGVGEGVNDHSNINVLHTLVMESKQESSGKLDQFRRHVVDTIDPVIAIELLPLNEGTTFTERPNALQSKDSTQTPLFRFVFDSSDGAKLMVRIFNMGDEEKSINVTEVLTRMLGRQVKDVREVPIDLNGSIEELEAVAREDIEDFTSPWDTSKDDKSGHHLEANAVRAFEYRI